jgi:hypothetical protein
MNGAANAAIRVGKRSQPPFSDRPATDRALAVAAALYPRERSVDSDKGCPFRFAQALEERSGGFVRRQIGPVGLALDATIVTGHDSRFNMSPLRAVNVRKHRRGRRRFRRDSK